MAVAIAPDGTAFVANAGSGTVSAFSTTATGTPTATSITVGAGILNPRPDVIAISTDGTTTYVADTGDNTVTPITVSGATVTAPRPMRRSRSAPTP